MSKSLKVQYVSKYVKSDTRNTVYVHKVLGTPEELADYHAVQSAQASRQLAKDDSGNPLFWGSQQFEKIILTNPQNGTKPRWIGDDFDPDLDRAMNAGMVVENVKFGKYTGTITPDSYHAARNRNQRPVQTPVPAPPHDLEKETAELGEI